MKFITAIVKPFKLDDVRNAISEVGVQGVTVTDVDSLADEVVAAITKSAQTGKVGDGKIFVFDLAQVVRIRTDERDAGAI